MTKEIITDYLPIRTKRYHGPDDQYITEFLNLYGIKSWKQATQPYFVLDVGLLDEKQMLKTYKEKEILLKLQKVISCKRLQRLKRNAKPVENIAGFIQLLRSVTKICGIKPSSAFTFNEHPGEAQRQYIRFIPNDQKGRTFFSHHTSQGDDLKESV